jgi:hypothetical protein
MITTPRKEHLRNLRAARRIAGASSFETTSAIVWRGQSPADGAPIFLIVTNLVRPSENRKTGDMAQAYILRSDMRPRAAQSAAMDAATCGNCPFRPSLARDGRPPCYVNTGWLGRLWDAADAGRIPDVAPAAVGRYLHAASLPLRQGAYGDPGMVPVAVWRSLDRTRGTSYSHQWAEPYADDSLAEFAMASVETVDEKNAANARGFRTYRVTIGALEADEIICPESTRGVNCAACGLCGGNRVDAKNIVIRPIGRGR